MLEAMLEGMLQASSERVARLTELVALEGEIARLELETGELKAQREALLDGVWGKGAPPCEELPQIDEPPASAPLTQSDINRMADYAKRNLGRFGKLGSPYSRAVDVTGRRLNDPGVPGAFRHTPIEPMSRAPRVTMAPELMEALGQIASFPPVLSPHGEEVMALMRDAKDEAQRLTGIDMGEPGGDQGVTAEVKYTAEGKALILAIQDDLVSAAKAREEDPELSKTIDNINRRTLDAGWTNLLKGIRREA